MIRSTAVTVLILATIAMAGIPTQPGARYELKFHLGPGRYDAIFGEPRGLIQFDKQHYVDRFGAFPDAMLWTNTPPDYKLAQRIVGSVMVEHENYPYDGFDPWDPKPSKDQVLPNYMIVLQSVKASSSDTLRVPDVALVDTLKWFTGPDDAGGAYYVQFEINGFDLPVPADGSAWAVWTEIWDTPGDPATNMKIESDTMYIVRNPIETVTDSLMWYYQPGAVSKTDTSYLYTLTKEYPRNIHVINDLLNFYYETENCDSLQAVADRCLAYIDTSSVVQERYREGYPPILNSMIEDVCVRGKAEPGKYDDRMRRLIY